VIVGGAEQLNLPLRRIQLYGNAVRHPADFQGLTLFRLSTKVSAKLQVRHI